MRLGGLAAFVLMAASLPRGLAAAEVAASYRMYWAGLPAGEIQLSMRDEATAYHDRIEIRSEGLPHLATRFRGTATSEGRVAAERPAPARYDAAYDLRKSKNRRLSMRFDLRGGAVVADRGADDTSKKPPLAERFRTNVLDPLSALTAIRDELRRGNRGSFSVPVYDGARRFDVVAKVLPKPAGDRVLRLELTLSPIAGFKGETSEDGDPDNAPRPVSLTMSDDPRLMPLSMSTSLFYLPLLVQLTHSCDNATPCSR